MPRFSANLTFLFNEFPFPDRFSAARAAGFQHVEYAFPYDYEPETLKSALRDSGLRQVLFNLPLGDDARGDTGLASHPDKTEAFREGVERALEYARILEVQRINCLAGVRHPEVPLSDQWRLLVENVGYAASRLAKEDRLLLVEPLNTYDNPGFILNRSKEARRLLDEVGAPNLCIQYDVYHMQKMEGNLTETIRECLDRIGHIQIADNPGRGRPGSGEISYRFLLDELDRIGYHGFVGVEYISKARTEESLAWIKDWGYTL